MKKIILIGTILSAILSFNSYASAHIADKCPSVKAIQSADLSGVKFIKDQDDEGWIGQQQSVYDTKDEWSFVVGIFKDTDATTALTKARASLPTLHKVMGPDKIDYEGTEAWICVYSDMQKEGVSAMTLTPPHDFPPSQFKKYKK